MPSPSRCLLKFEIRQEGDKIVADQEAGGIKISTEFQNKSELYDFMKMYLIDPLPKVLDHFVYGETAVKELPEVYHKTWQEGELAQLDGSTVKVLSSEYIKGRTKYVRIEHPNMGLMQAQVSKLTQIK
jgi:hypothetical protein